MSLPIAGVIKAFVENMKPVGDWSSLAIVLEFDSKALKADYGFAYMADGTHKPVSVFPRLIRDEVKAFTDSYDAPGRPLPLKLLVQFDRASGEYDVAFEYEDASRWHVSPATIAEIPGQLRPDFA